MKALFFTYRGALAPLLLLPALVLPSVPHGGWRYGAGTVFILLGLYFRLMAVRLIGGRARVHSTGIHALITSGIYSHVRNPVYIGNISFIAGVTALYFSLLSSLVTAILFFLFYTIIVLHEEQSLLLQIGAAYNNYRKSVPRWLIKSTPHTSPQTAAPPLPLMKICWIERSFILMCLGFSAFAPFWNAKLCPLLRESMPSELHVPVACAALGLISAIKFLRIAERLQRKRGNWCSCDALGRFKHSSAGNNP